MSVESFDTGMAARTARRTIVSVDRAVEDRNRLTCFFRPILAVPHILLVGAPVALGATFGSGTTHGSSLNLGTGTGALGLLAGICALIAWFAILFTGVYPNGLWDIVAFYLRWRVRALAYMTLLRDEYPPFGEGAYPAHVVIAPAEPPRNRWTTAFRFFLLIPHFVVVWILSLGWFFTTLAGWFSILFTGGFPRTLYDYGVGVLRWSTRVEAYLLLLHDEYPPFTLE